MCPLGACVRAGPRARARAQRSTPRARDAPTMRIAYLHCFLVELCRLSQIVRSWRKLGKRYFLSPDAEPRERSAARVLQQLHHGRLHSGGALEASAAPQAVRVNAPPRRSPRTLHDFDHGTTRDAMHHRALRWLYADNEARFDCGKGLRVASTDHTDICSSTAAWLHRWWRSFARATCTMAVHAVIAVCL